MTGFNRILFLLLVFTPAASIAAGTDFNMAAQLLSAARNGNTRLMQNLINSGANVNYVDSTGLSVVCTAVMNNDVRAVQVLQMYGADASQCDRQIKNYRARNNPTSDTGVFSGLSPTHKLMLGAVGVAGGIAGVLWATDAFGGGGGDSGVGTGGHGSNSGGGSGNDGTNANVGFTIAAGYCLDGECDPQFWQNLNGNGVYMTNNGINYLDVIGAYDAFARGYLGLTTWRGTNNAPIDLSNYNAPAGGRAPVLVAMVNKTGVNLGGSISSNVDIEYIKSCSGTTCSVESINKIYNNTDGATTVDFNFSSDASVFGSATDSDTKLAKIISGYTSDADTGGNDWVGVVPNSTLAIFKTGGQSVTKGYQNYEAMNNAARIGYTPAAVVNLENISGSELLDYYTLQSAKSVVASVQTANDKQTAYKNLIDDKYNTASLTSNTPGDYAGELFSYYQGTDYKWKPIVVMSAGNNVFTNYSVEEATFENYVPVVYTNMEHLFATTVAVAKNTSNNLMSLSAWDTNSDGVVDTVSRKCGLAGKGDSGVDPWCFAAPGQNDLEAAATMAGAVGLLKGAFNYLTNEQIFILLATTADGAYLGTDPSTGEPWQDGALEGYLNGLYELPAGYGDLTVDKFKEFFGYGVINLNRATTPGKSVNYFTNGKIVAANGNAYWRTAAISKLHGSNVFGARGATIPVAAYDVVRSSDGAMSVMRQWNTDVALGGDASHGLYLGDTLAELKTRDVDNSVTVGNFKFGFARSERAYDDNMSGVDALSIAWDNDRFGFKSEYQHYLTDGAGRFGGLANPILALTSNALSNAVELKSGRFGVLGRAFVGNITTDGLLENDPAVSNNFASAKLGDVMGAESGLSVRGDKLSIATNFGTMHETNTVLGAAGYGFLDLGGADTNYIDSVIKYSFNDWANLTLRGTYAWTRTGDVAGGVINGLSELKSNAFAAGMNFGNFELMVSMPLALTSGAMRYSVADVGMGNNGALVVNNFGERSIDLTPETREYRLNASYRHKFGEWTDGALGFIYRVNPNNTDAFGNESIFMMKLSHRLGI